MHSSTSQSAVSLQSTRCFFFVTEKLCISPISLYFWETEFFDLFGTRKNHCIRKRRSFAIFSNTQYPKTRISVPSL